MNVYRPYPFRRRCDRPPATSGPRPPSLRVPLAIGAFDPDGVVTLGNPAPADLRVVRERGLGRASPRPGREAGSFLALRRRPPGRRSPSRAAPPGGPTEPPIVVSVSTPPAAGRDHLRNLVDPDGRHRSRVGRDLEGVATVARKVRDALNPD